MKLLDLTICCCMFEIKNLKSLYKPNKKDVHPILKDLKGCSSFNPKTPRKPPFRNVRTFLRHVCKNDTFKKLLFTLLETPAISWLVALTDPRLVGPKLRKAERRKKSRSKLPSCWCVSEITHSQPVWGREVGSLSPLFTGFYIYILYYIYPRWLGMGFLNQQYLKCGSQNRSYTNTPLKSNMTDWKNAPFFSRRYIFNVWLSQWLTFKLLGNTCHIL